MGRRAKHWMHVAIGSGLPGLLLIVGGCIAVTLILAKDIDEDEAAKVVLVTFLGTFVAIYRIWSTNRKQRGGDG